MSGDLLQRVTLPPNARIFQAGEVGDAMYLVESGRVRIYAEENETTRTIKEMGLGEFFGEMALVDYKPRSASAETLEVTTLLVITKENFHTMVLNNPNVALLLIQVLSERLRALTAEVERLQGQRNAP